MTTHKSQGQTMDNAIIDLATCRGTETPYVMVSRVWRLDDLLILRPFPIGKIKCRMSEDTRREHTRLQYHHFNTMFKHGSAAEREKASKEIAVLKQTVSTTQLKDILATSLVEQPPTSAPDARPAKRRKVSVIVLHGLSTEIHSTQ